MRPAFVFIVMLFASTYSISAECPCENFVADLQNIQEADVFNDSSKLFIRLSNCMKCREKLGLNYYFCQSWLQQRNSKYSSTLKWYEPPEYYLSKIISKSTDKCNDSIPYEIETHIEGTGFIRGGIALFTLGIVDNIFAPSVLRWGFDESIIDEYNWTGGFIFLGRAIVSIIYCVVGVAGYASGTTLITMGTHKYQTFKAFNLERPLFERDMKQLNLISYDF